MSFGLAGNALRRAVRAPDNPLDKSTIVSVYPRGFTEVKHTTQPGTFKVPGGSREKPGILLVGTSSWWKDIDPEQPLIEITQSSIQVAASVITDYCNGLLCCDMGAARPGLFYIPGNHTQDEILEGYQSEIDVAASKQRNWYSELVKMADILWARSHGNPLSISDDMRLAAQELQTTEKAWLQDFNTMQLENCPACGQLRDAKFPVCQHCHTIVNQKQYDSAGFQKAV